MKVKELIAKLQSHDPEAIVTIGNSEGDYGATTVEVFQVRWDAKWDGTRFKKTEDEVERTSVHFDYGDAVFSIR